MGESWRFARGYLEFPIEANQGAFVLLDVEDQIGNEFGFLEGSALRVAGALEGREVGQEAVDFGSQ